MQDEKITQAAADAFGWFHSIDLGHGIVTKGFKTLDRLRHEADIIFKHGVAGKTVLDIGAWDGANSFEAERRGAARVVASDHFCWVGPGWGKKASFDFAKRALGSRVEEKVASVEDLSPTTVGTFDVVLFLGVLYHLKNPLLGLEHAAALTHDLLVVETETAFNALDRPVMLFLPGAELNEDPTNWWAPNVACVQAMLGVAGFNHIEVTLEIEAPPPRRQKQRSLARRVVKSVRGAVRPRKPIEATTDPGYQRATFHAWK